MQESLESKLGRCCKAHVHDCHQCPLYPKGTTYYHTANIRHCLCRVSNIPGIIDAVEKWAEEHPIKTYKDVLKERMPFADVDMLSCNCLKPYFGEYAHCPYEDTAVPLDDKRGLCEGCWDRICPDVPEEKEAPNATE